MKCHCQITEESHGLTLKVQDYQNRACQLRINKVYQFAVAVSLEFSTGPG
jgi:hypothetical protein